MTEPPFHQLVPEEPDLVPTVRIDAVWNDLIAAIEASPARKRLFAMYSEREVAKNQHTVRLEVQETAVAFLNICLRHAMFTPRIDGGARFYRVPAEAFVPPFESHGLPNADANTWARGALHRLDAAKPFQWIAAGGYALLLTENEASIVREWVRTHIADEEREHRLTARDRILDRARRGEMSAREAEVEATQQGLGELASRPPADDFDPRNRPAWTLPMALAWIAWRSYDEVREWDSEYRDKCLVWTTSNDHTEGRRLKRRDPATVWEFECMGYLRQAEHDSCDSDLTWDVDRPKRAKGELWAALRDGDGITADGIPRNGAKRLPIPSIEWEDLRDHASGLEALRYHHSPHESAYAKVRIPRAQIVARWPADTEAEDEAPRTGPPDLQPAVRRPIGRPPKQGIVVDWMIENPIEAAKLSNKEIALKCYVNSRTVERAKASQLAAKTKSRDKTTE